MNDIMPRSSGLPMPRVPVSVRPATLDDLPFIDALQKQHKKQLGFMYTGTLQGKIKLGHVIIAEEVSGQSSVVSGQSSVVSGEADGQRTTDNGRRAQPVGYCIGNDQYFKRDDLGIIYQLNVVPGKRRSLIGATLIKAMFDRAAYGCRLFCCWCAQDIEANRFWESLGFVPLAFRAGSKSKDRVHIFWQKRIREGDVGEKATPWWFPSKTAGGAIGEERLVLPIPPGKHWSDEVPRLLPTQLPALADETKKPATHAPHAPRAPKVPKRRFVQFGPPDSSPPPPPAPTPAAEKPRPAKKPKQKYDRRYVAAARELRDRAMEYYNSGQLQLASTGKYDVVRQLEARGAGAGAGASVEPRLIAAA